MNLIHKTAQIISIPTEKWLLNLSKSQIRWGRVFSAIIVTGLLLALIRKVGNPFSKQSSLPVAPAPVTPALALPVKTLDVSPESEGDPKPVAPALELLRTIHTSSPKEDAVHPRDATPPRSPNLEPPRKKVAARPKDAPVIYFKGITKTPCQAQTDRKEIGRGESGKVFGHKHRTDHVVKKSSMSMANEFKIGMRLNHPRFVQMHHYYIKKDGIGEKHKLVMDRLGGDQIYKYYVRTIEKLPLEQLKQFIIQTEEACLHLFERGVFWRDIHPHNIFVSPDLKQITFLDFDKWKLCDDPKHRARQLLLASMEIMGWLVKSSAIRTPERNPDKEMAVIFPKEFFKEQIQETQIVTYYSENYDNVSWMKPFEEQLNSTSAEDYPKLLSAYFNAVREKLAAL